MPVSTSSEISSGASAWLKEARGRWINPLLRPEGVFLEFGARDPWNLRSAHSVQKIACAPRCDGVALARDEVRVVETIENCEPDVADLAMCDQVLEYLLDPLGTVEELKRVIKPGGHILVQVLYDPDFRTPRFDREVEHYFSWNVQTMGNLLVDCGYEFVSGSVIRLPVESEVLRKNSGFRRAALTSKLWRPVRLVRVVARRPGA
jgi:SAM-dependent methyltransferase